MKFATKPIQHYASHLQHVATLPWKIKNSNFLQQIWKKMQTNCVLIASNFVIYPQILIYSVFKIASLSPYCLQIKFSMSMSFCLITFAINLKNCGTGNSLQQTSLQRLSTINMVFSDKYKILIRSLYLKGCTAKRLTNEFQKWVIY